MSPFKFANGFADVSPFKLAAKGFVTLGEEKLKSFVGAFSLLAPKVNPFTAPKVCCGPWNMPILLNGFEVGAGARGRVVLRLRRPLAGAILRETG